MLKPSDAHVDAASRLLAAERGSDGDAELRGGATARVWSRLFDTLAPLVGDAGARALLARSAQLHAAELPGLAEALKYPAAQTDDGEVARHLSSDLGALQPEAAAAAEVALLGTFLALLTTFIGEGLVSRLVTGSVLANGQDQGDE